MVRVSPENNRSQQKNSSFMNKLALWFSLTWFLWIPNDCIINSFFLFTQPELALVVFNQEHWVEQTSNVLMETLKKLMALHGGGWFTIIHGSDAESGIQPCPSCISTTHPGTFMWKILTMCLEIANLITILFCLDSKSLFFYD